MLFAVTPSRDMLRANLFPRIRPSDRVWAGAADVSAMTRGVSMRVLGMEPVARAGRPASMAPEPFPTSTDLVAAPLATSPGRAAAFTVILSVAVDVKGRPPGPLPASSMRTGNVPGLGGVHCSNVTVRRCRGKRTPRLFVATILFSTFSVPRTSLNMWSKGFVTVKARLTGWGAEGAEAADMAGDVEEVVPCGPVPPPVLIGALVPPVPPIVVVPEAVPLMA